MNICKFVVSIFVISVLFSCKPTIKKKLVSKPEDLQGEWKLCGVLQDTSIINREFGERKPFIKLDHAKHQVQGFSGCNSFSGSSFEEKMTVLAYCP